MNLPQRLTVTLLTLLLPTLQPLPLCALPVRQLKLTNDVAVESGIIPTQDTDPPPTDPRKRPLAEIRYEDYQNYYTINLDYTYTQVISTRTTLLTPRSLQNWQRASLSYYPDTQSLQVVEAYVIQPNGQRIPVTANNIFTRPSEASQDAPGFDSSLTTTVIFPRLQVGSQTYVKWKFIQKKPSLAGLSEIEMPIFSYSSRQEVITVSMPVNLKLRWAKQGSYTVTDEVKVNRRVLTATLKNYQGRQTEVGMPDTQDIGPYFMFSNLDRWEDLGATYWKQSQPKVQVTPEIKALAERIAGSKTGIDAARSIYNWVAQNIHYVAVYLNEDAGWVPHSVTEILKNGYGDCKDHVALMQSLLKAKGIEAVPVLVDWGDQYQKFPLPMNQFNHAMIYLPAFNLFANPTDEMASFGELDTSLSGKFVVLATPTGATAFTPASKPEENRYVFNGNLTIDAKGTITGQANIKLTGQDSSDIRTLFTSNTPEQLADSLLDATPEGGYGSLKISNLHNLDQPVTIQGSWTSPLAVELGKQAFLAVPIGLNIRQPQRFRQYISYSDRLYPQTHE